MPKTEIKQPIDSLVECIIHKNLDGVRQHLAEHPELKTDSRVYAFLAGSPYRSLVELFFESDDAARLAGIPTIVDESDSDFSDTDSDFDTEPDSESDLSGEDILDVSDFFENFLAPTDEVRGAVQAVSADPALYEQYHPDFVYYLTSFYSVYVHEANRQAADAGFEQALKNICARYQQFVEFGGNVAGFVDWWQQSGKTMCDKCFGELSSAPARYFLWYNWIVSQDIVNVAKQYSQNLPPGDTSQLSKVPFLRQKLDSNPGMGVARFIDWWKNEGKGIFFNSFITANASTSSSAVSSFPVIGLSLPPCLPGSSQSSFFSTPASSLESLPARNKVLRDWQVRPVKPDFNLFTHIVRHLKKPHLAIQMLDDGILGSDGNPPTSPEVSVMPRSRPSKKRDVNQMKGMAGEPESIKRHCN